MEYFDFEDASHAIPQLDLDELSSLTGEACEADATDCFDSLFFDKSAFLPATRPAPPTTVMLKLINNIEIEAIPHPSDISADYPMFRAKEPCELCAKMGLDCFLATRGAMVTGCTCCISLYRECSFVHPKIPRGFVNTFPGIAEDQQIPENALTERRRAMKSMEEGRGRKTGARFPRDAVKILKQWLAEHADHPYPNEREKDELKQLTGLKRSQISNWLANARRRGKVRPAESGPSSPMLGAIDIPQSQDGSGIADLNPLDRWKASPPEHEPASMTAIARAVTSTPLPVRNPSVSSLQGSRPNSRPSSRKASSEDDSSFSMFRAPSVSSFETRESSNSDLTFASSRSNRSKGSFASSQDRRRRRRAPVAQRAAAQQAKARAARIFQCTFCTDSFPAKYDWQRHEKSLHLALERWSCCPNGGTMTDALTGLELCVFCREPNPSTDHLESHNFNACQEKTVQERTFYRKDHLSQHLKLMHNAKVQSHMETWKSTTNELKSGCGFCPSKFTTWQQRADHLAAHFRNGADMAHWAGDWGFEPYVERLVENAIPPYLIGHERNTMEPYVARAMATPSSATEGGLTTGTSAESTEPDQITKDSNCWGRLEQELSKFVSQQKALGQIPSDKDLQDQARMIIYEDNDPWNWTCADNQQWLDTFKYSQGIGNTTGATVASKSLAEVPILAPYVIKGGLKSKPATSQNHTRRNLSTDSTCDSFKATPDCGSMPNSAAVATFDNGMELDFDSIDFSNLDLGIVDEMNFDMEFDNNQGGGVASGMPVSTTPFSSSIPGDTLFGSYGVSPRTNMGMGMNAGMPLQQTKPQNSSPQLMSEQDMSQLTGYMSGFN
ncbi:hypothetical protein G647_02381 [Cladophialophora carrionii CBS 160.54]|uniref:Homeobox and C2H2 transcription factor n=1 Tax=Cladophialophora carrionii CBS 160.54 TaxID=1279043 RepID=V9DI27_9EURO|nr:uncharacterized protein G647_02381 [Cladophialophora carrionii CBS 160.54]ETI25607.1 hypothetical protein G647_02381 [Cladophialophora carrionii CBS 160.54]